MDLLAREASVPSSKTAAGMRRIPLNDDAFLGFRLMYDRAVKLDAARPDRFVFLACENAHFDPQRPQTSWRTAWRSLTKAADLKGLRFHDLKHQCVTELAENAAPEDNDHGIGWPCSRRMLEHYSHIRMEPKRKALKTLLPIATRNVEIVAPSLANCNCVLKWQGRKINGARKRMKNMVGPWGALGFESLPCQFAGRMATSCDHLLSKPWCVKHIHAQRTSGSKWP